MIAHHVRIAIGGVLGVHFDKDESIFLNQSGTFKNGVKVDCNDIV